MKTWRDYKNKVFVDNMRGVLEYRTIEYYRKRYNMNELLVYLGRDKFYLIKNI